MKKLLLCLSLLCGVQASNAQYYLQSWVGANQNPGGLNNDDEYPSGGGLSATWSLVHGPSATPTWSAATNIPFAFNFNGAPVTQYKVSNSAVVTFDVGSTMAAPGFVPTALPSASIPDMSVCVWGIKGTGTNDNVMQKTFGTAPNRQHWIFFTSYSTTGTNYHYFAIVLEETSNIIHAVDMRNVVSGTNPLTIGIQINGTTALQVAGSPSAPFSAGSSFTPADNSYYSFIPGVQPALDLSAQAISTNEYVVAGNVNIAGTIRNLGSSAITSLTMNYTDNGGAVVSAPITGINIAANADYNFVHPTPWNATIGTHNIEVYASNLNGSPDLVPANDKKAKTINVLNKIIKRTPLIEVYTSSTCPPCKPGNENLHSIIDTLTQNIPVTVKFQQDFPGTGDPYATAEAISRRTSVYAINSIPRLELDGGWDGNASSFTYPLLQAAANIPAQFELSGEYVNDYNAKKLSGKVRYSPAFNNVAGNTILHIAILEKVTTKNVKNNGELEFLQVMKKMVPSNAGTALPAISVGAIDSTAFSYTFNGSYRLPTDGQTANVINHSTEHSVEDFNNLYVVAWLQSPNKNVFQAAFLNKNVPTGINSMASIKDVSVYPNPTADNINITIENINSKEATILLIDSKGAIVVSKQITLTNGKSTTQIDATNLSSGVYSIAILDDHNNSISKQVVIK